MGKRDEPVMRLLDYLAARGVDCSEAAAAEVGAKTGVGTTKQPDAFLDRLEQAEKRDERRDAQAPPQSQSPI